MSNGQYTSVLGYLRRLAANQESRSYTDAQLLKRFTQQQDESAFELLVWRHAAMVLRTCQRILYRSHDIDDAFQATFLAFIKQAKRIKTPSAVAGWLYKTAYQIACRIKSEQARQQTHSQLTLTSNVSNPDSSLEQQEFQQALDEEVNLLPRKYRIPFILYYLDGKSTQETARELDCPPATISTRLKRARERLRSRLAVRGITISASVLVTYLMELSTTAGIAQPLIQETIHAALVYNAGSAACTGILSNKVIYLAEGVLKAMFLSKVKMAAMIVLASILIIGVSGWLGKPEVSADDSGLQTTSTAQKQRQSTPPAESDKDKAKADRAAYFQQLLLAQQYQKDMQLAIQRQKLDARIQQLEVILKQKNAEALAKMWQARMQQDALQQIENGLKLLKQTTKKDKAKKPAVDVFAKAFANLKQKLQVADLGSKDALEHQFKPSLLKLWLNEAEFDKELWYQYYKRLSDLEMQRLSSEEKLATPGNVQGVIQSVADDLLLITIGSKQGIRKGEVLHIYRLQPQPVYLGKLRVLDVSEKGALGKRIRGSGTMSIQKNDKVIRAQESTDIKR